MKVLCGFCILLLTLLTSPKDAVCKSQVFITPAKPVVKLGDPLTLNCSTSCSPNKPRWRLMRDSSSMTKKDHEQFSVMELLKVTLDVTSFRCESKCGATTSSAEVKVYYFTALTLTSDPPEVVSGHQVQLKCRVNVHPALSAKLKLKRGDTVLSEPGQCKDGEDNRLKECEVSATDVAHNQYRCEVTLQIDSSHRNESASLQLKLKEAAENTESPVYATSSPLIKSPSTSTFDSQRSGTQSSTSYKEAARSTVSPVKATSTPLTKSTSTAALTTESVTIKSERSAAQSSTAFKESAALNNTPSTVLLEKQKSDAKSLSVGLIVGLFVMILVGVVAAFLFFRYRKHKESQTAEKPDKETPPPHHS